MSGQAELSVQKLTATASAVGGHQADCGLLCCNNKGVGVLGEMAIIDAKQLAWNQTSASQPGGARYKGQNGLGLAAHGACSILMGEDGVASNGGSVAVSVVPAGVGGQVVAGGVEVLRISAPGMTGKPAAASIVNLRGLPAFADDAAATAGGLTLGDLYVSLVGGVSSLCVSV